MSKVRKIALVVWLMLFGSLVLTINTRSTNAHPKQNDISASPNIDISTLPSPASVLACLTSISYGDTIQCSIDSTGETDQITFVGNAGERVRIRVVETSGSLIAYQELRRPNGTTLCGPTSVLDLTCLLDSTGTYTIRVFDNNNTDTGGYSLHLLRLNNPVNCSSISYDALPSIGSIDLPTEYDCITFNGEINEKVRVRMTETSGALIAYQEWLRPDGTSLCGPSSLVDLDCVLDTSGTHTILISDNNGLDTGGYRIYIQRLNNPVGCTSISIGAQPVSGFIDLPTEYDCFKFSSAASDRVRIRLVDNSGTIIAYQEILRPDGNTVCGPSSLLDLNCFLDTSGTHTILISDNNGKDTGGYSLFIQRLNNPVGCTSINYGTNPLSGSINFSAEFDCFTFNGALNDMINIPVDETSGSLLAYREVLRPDGNTICGPSSLQELSCLLDASGSHTILVSDNNGIDTGNYQIGLTCLSGDCGNTPPTPTPIPTPVPPPGDILAFIPVLSREKINYFEGPWEKEDNDSYLKANGPIRSNRNYFGYPNDQKDYFSIYMQKSGSITVDVTNHSGSGVQLQIFFNNVTNRVCFDPSAPHHCKLNGQPGYYYVYIFTESGFNNNTAYTLFTTFP